MYKYKLQASHQALKYKTQNMHTNHIVSLLSYYLFLPLKKGKKLVLLNNITQIWLILAQDAEKIPCSLRHTMKTRLSEHGPTLHCTGVDLKCYLQFWVSQQKKGVKLLECVQKRGIKKVKSLKGNTECLIKLACSAWRGEAEGGPSTARYTFLLGAENGRC